MGWAVATCLFWAAVLSISFPLILHAFTPTGAIGFYAALNVVAFIMIFLWLPETKQRTLEELDYIFGVPTKKFISYNFNVALPWWWRRWVLWDRTAKLEPLYRFEGGVEGASQETRRAEHVQAVEGDEKAVTTTKEVK
jgi:hypothetical protein